MRGQSSIEYLMTYGWALLVLTILIAALFSTGVFSPSYLISEDCNLGPKLPCKFLLSRDTTTGTNTNIAVEVTNNFGYKIAITNIEIRLPDESLFRITTPPNPSLANPLIINSGAPIRLNGLISRSLPKNTLTKLKMKIDYFSCAQEVLPTGTPPDRCPTPNSNAIHTISGRINGKVI